MAFDSNSTLDNDKAQHEALVQEVGEPQSKISLFSLVWKPAVFLLIPLALLTVSVYLGFSWTEYFQDDLRTNDWTDRTWDSYNRDLRWACLSNGKVVSTMDSPSVWNTDQFLDINLGFGSFEFGIAKGIDIGWDLIVGRGGQIILALVSYRVLSAVLLHSMETQSTSFYTYTAVGFDRGPLFTIRASSRDLWNGRGRGRGVLFMVIYVSLYLLAFPTFVSCLRSKAAQSLTSDHRSRL